MIGDLPESKELSADIDFIESFLAHKVVTDFSFKS